MKSKLNTTLESVVKAVAHYHKTGKHRQVSFRYDPEVRTEYSFKSWRHERDADSIRSILPEDIMVSSEGNMYVVGKSTCHHYKTTTLNGRGATLRYLRLL